MKRRAGFVSNSSSSSFVFDKRYLSAHQAEAIVKYTTKDDPERWEYWSITEDEDFIRGFTSMDNGCLSSFMKDFSY